MRRRALAESCETSRGSPDRNGRRPPTYTVFQETTQTMSDAAINWFKTDQRSHQFTLYEQFKIDELFDVETYGDFFAHLTREDCDAVMDQCYRFCNEVSGPLNSIGDRTGCKLEDGQTITPAGYKEAWEKLYELGLPNFQIGLEAGGFQGPSSVAVVLGEMQSGANISFTMYPGLTHGSLELVENFALEKDKKLFVEPMISGRFSGTMCLSEPQAGSDVGALTSKAVHVDGNKYKITGTKCWISGGDHDMAENIVHLVLARVEGAPEGTKGISLFIVPKHKVNDDGSTGESNDVITASIEHKLGINSSTTAVLSFGENDNCEGFLVGETENVGMKQMFHMMNGARIAVGVQGLAVAATAYQNALAYARDRKQGSSVKAFKDPNAPRVSILEHSDVRRMLMEMKAKVDGMRALCTYLSVHQDKAVALKAKGDHDSAIYHQGQVDLLTPIVKSYCSDQSFRVCETALQVYGGAGFVRDNPVEQYLRDAKIFSIYEGTNHIQALDLVVRKLRHRDGKDLNDFVEGLVEFVTKHGDDPACGEEIQLLADAGREIQEAGRKIIQYMMTGKLDQLTLCASPFLEAMAHVTVAYLLLDAAMIAETARTQDEDQSQEEFDFYAGKVMAAKFYVNFILPQALALSRVIKSGDRSALDVPDSGFSTAW
jgi:alkylation response protein AidB-like acyl-CoA dehydrogenase